MGGLASQPLQKVKGSVLRKAGEPLNTLGYQKVHEKSVITAGTKPVRVTVCRCWQSLRFPLCDNTHQRLQKLGCNVGPVMVEIKSKPMPVSASPSPSSGPERLGGTLSAATLGGAAALMTGAGVAGATGSFPM